MNSIQLLTLGNRSGVAHRPAQPNAVRFGITQPSPELPPFSWHVEQLQKLHHLLLGDLSHSLESPKTITETLLRPLNHIVGQVMATHPHFPEFRDPKALLQVFEPVIHAIGKIPESDRAEVLMLLMTQDVADKKVPHNFLRDAAALSMPFHGAPVMIYAFRELQCRKPEFFETLPKQVHMVVGWHVSDFKTVQTYDAWLKKVKARYPLENLGDRLTAFMAFCKTDTITQRVTHAYREKYGLVEVSPAAPKPTANRLYQALSGLAYPLLWLVGAHAADDKQ